MEETYKDHPIQFPDHFRTDQKLKHKLISPFRWQNQYFNACITMIFKYFKHHSSGAQELGAVVIADGEYFYEIRERGRHVLFLAHPTTQHSPESKKTKQKSPQLPDQLTGKTC